MRVGLISDTHGMLRPEVFPAFEGVELILHAGDVGNQDIITELNAIAPVRAVIGNTDGFDLAVHLKQTEILTLNSRTVVVTHGHLLGSPRVETLRRAHPDAHIIVYGHTHKPLVQRYDGALIVNPGAAGPARFNLKPSVAILDLGGAEEAVRLIEL